LNDDEADGDDLRTSELMESKPDNKTHLPAQSPEPPPVPTTPSFTLLPAEPGQVQPAPGALRFSKRRLALAFAISAVSDLLSVWLTFAPPVEWAVDFTTALLLFAVLGWQWMLLPGLVLEAIPGVYVFPFWVLVVAAVAVWGTARPKMN
jgi:hypothetical protein